jgi:hypothetical protein
MIRRWLRGVVTGRCGSRALFYAAAIAAAGLVLGCGSTSTQTTRAASTAGATSTSTAATTAEAQPVPVALHLDEGSYSLSAPAATIAGTATRGASVTVNGHAVAVHSGRWRDTLHLHIGSNPIEVQATMSGHAPTTAAIRVTRRHSAAELEASARARELRAEEHRRHEAEARERKQREEQAKQAEQQSQKLAECTNGTYVNSAGNTVCKPVESSTQPAGATAECEDGTYSFSESRSGTCSHHGGVKRWLNE